MSDSKGITPIVRFSATFGGTIEDLRRVTSHWPGDARVVEVEVVSEEMTFGGGVVATIYSITAEQEVQS